MRPRSPSSKSGIGFDKLEEFVRQEEARGAELVQGSVFERALALLITQRELRGGKSMEQIVIAYKKIREAARLLAAANERTLAAEAEALAKQVDRKNVQ